jgi:hypothetical protein
MPALTESEARARAALLTIDSYDVSIDLTVTPARSSTVIRFRCARPGAASFADLAAPVRGGAARLNGAPLGPPADGRLALADGDASAAVGPLDLTLRAGLVKTLAIRGLASPADLASLTEADAVAGRPLRVTCEAARPDPAAKEAAWAGALDERNPQWLARAHAEGIWIAGQEPLLTGYRQRYFTEAMPALSVRDARGEGLARRLADLLFPVTLDEETTVMAVRAALEADGLTDRLRTILQTQEAELRTAVEVR